LKGPPTPPCTGSSTRWPSSRRRGRPSPDRLFHAELLSGINNALVGQLVTAFWDVYSGVLPRLGLTLPEDLQLTVCAHGDMLRAAESGDVETFRLAVVAHYQPLLRALETQRPPAEG